jgi:mannose/cellobiose epimerase-like protein (N-acyl-D-glucosamine 2-epimerase family)
MGTGNLIEWMQQDVLPFWAEHGRDAESGWFHERLTAAGLPEQGAVQRIRVQFRQIYTYSHAALLGWHKQGRAIALKAFHETMKCAWAVDGQPGFVHLISADGRIENPVRDSYDHAFAVLALTWLKRATGDAAVSKALEDTLVFVDNHLTAEDGSLREGWQEGHPPSLPRRQNPNMHWFEAMLALKETRGHPSADERLERARRHFDRMFDLATHTIGEYFDDDWLPVAGHLGDTVEPGHLAEWAWLLRQHERILGQKPHQLPSLLIDAARRGSDPATGFLVDETDRSGTVRRGTRRIWLQTELVKAFLADAEIRVPGAEKQARKAIAMMETHYLRKPFHHGWIDQLDEDLKPVHGPVQSSILYHLFVAVAEAARVLGETHRPTDDATPIHNSCMY